jgi:serine/threonine protein kinase
MVRRAVHKDTKAVVALKTYEKKNLKQEDAQNAVHNEINTLSDLSHPNIMRLHEVID